MPVYKLLPLKQAVLTSIASNSESQVASIRPPPHNTHVRTAIMHARAMSPAPDAEIRNSVGRLLASRRFERRGRGQDIYTGLAGQKALDVCFEGNMIFLGQFECWSLYVCS
jgi:hypothetical protein